MDKRSASKRHHDGTFVSSMTFVSLSSVAQRGCDCCDECGLFNINNEIPFTIQQAVTDHKRFKSASRTQERSLIKREGGFTMYKLTMPRKAEPLVEYGSTHRIIYIEALCRETSTVLSIGKGVVGSADETKSRKTMGWEKGCAYLVPSNGGKALGWIHGDKSDKDKEKPSKPSSPVVLYTIKIPVEDSDGEDNESNSDENEDSWTGKMKLLCLKYVKENETSSSSFLLSTEDSEVVKRVIESLPEE